MALNGEEPIGSMGTDTALAVLSNKPRLLYDYFKQLFAQVTNPPLDAIREELVTSMGVTIGAEDNLLEPRPEACRQIKVDFPVLHNDQVAKLRHLPTGSPFRSTTLPLLYDPEEDGPGLERAMEQLCRKASVAVEAGVGVLILSDRGVDAHHAPIPSLLAVAGVHHHLVREGTRHKCGLLIETGEAREVHHIALLLGYGAGSVNPYLAFESLDDLIRQGLLPGVTHNDAVKRYIKALNKGVLKVMSKMGISTLQSYCGAQIFEAIGLDRAFVEKYFTSTASKIGGIGVKEISEEVRQRHARAYRRARRPTNCRAAASTSGAATASCTCSIPTPSSSCSTRRGRASTGSSRNTPRSSNDQSKARATLRGLFGLKPFGPPVPLDEVEPIESILPRFSTGAMSYGSISQEAHETLAIAMNRMGAKSNTGEGGEDPARYVPDANGDSRRSAIKQVASGRFGVTSEYLVNADDLQIKMAQGAKPGEGGQLPGHKVYPWIAKVRHSTPGVGLISPPPHHDIYSIEDLSQLIFDLKNANPAARVHVKLVAESGVGTVAAGRVEGARRRGPDLRSRRRHRRVAADQPQACRRAVGARPRRNAASAADERAARSHRRAGRRPDEDRPRRGRRRAARRRGVRVRHRAAGGDGLRDDARLPSQHLPGRHRHAGSGAAQDLQRQAGVRAELLPVHRRRSARADGGARLPHARSR